MGTPQCVLALSAWWPFFPKAKCFYSPVVFTGRVKKSSFVNENHQLVYVRVRLLQGAAGVYLTCGWFGLWYRSLLG